MKKEYLTTVMILFLTLSINQAIYSQNVVERFGRLQVNGNLVTAENGEKISLAGNSLFWSNAPETFLEDFYDARTINHLANDWRSAIIRPAIGVKESWDKGLGYIDSPEEQMAKLRIVIDAAIARGVYVLIDWHTHNAEQYTNEAAEFFGKIAELYGGYDNIIYEIYNEPLNSTSWDTIKNYSSSVIAAIRSQDPDNLIIVGTPSWSQDVHLAAQNPIWGDPNLAYTLHFYANSHGQWLRDRAQQAMNSGIAIFVTEYGTTYASGNGGFNPGETQAWFNFMRNNGISYVNWSIIDKNEDSSVVKEEMAMEGLLNGDLTESGIFIRNHMIDVGIPTLSVEDQFNLNNSIEVYPNPVQSILDIKSVSSIDKVIVYDIVGRIIVVYKEYNQGDNNDLKINLQSLNTGSYLLKVHHVNEITITKKIKKL